MARYNGAYSGEGGMGKLTRASEFGNTAQRHSIATEEFKEACNPWDHDTWKLGPVSSKKSEHGGGCGTEPVEANSPTGKYAKKGGSGQRSGS